MTTIETKGNLTLTKDGDHYIMEGGKYGMHSIFAPDYDDQKDARIKAHWEGYCENNGQNYDAIEESIEEDKNYYEAGDSMTIWINQGERDAEILATIDDKMIIEYEMPAGTTAMTIMDNKAGIESGRSISYKACPKKWIDAIREQTGGWEGNSQNRGYIDFPEEG